MVGPRTRVLRQGRIPVAIAICVLVGTATMGSVGAAGAPALTVTPSTALRDLQVVQIDGTGFTPQAPVAISECQAGPATPKSCDYSTLAFPVADSTGAVRASAKVRRLITIGQHQLDCATASACVIRAEGEADATTVDAPVSFDPNVPPVVPAVTVTPATGLSDHQLVRLDGSGFNPGASALVLECSAKKARRRAGQCEFGDNRSALIRADGTFTVRRFAVSRLLPAVSESESNTFDCATKIGSCVVMVETEDIGGTTTLAPLGFDPAQPPIVASTSITPASGLTDHQLVTVTGRGFLPGAPVQMIQCAEGTEVIFGGCDYASSSTVTAGFGGKFRLTVPVERLIAPATGVTSESTLDCVASSTACVLLVSSGSFDVPQPLRLSFDPRVPAQQASLRVQPAGGLGDNQRVAATGGGFAPFSTVALVQCSADAVDGDLSACDQASVQDVVASADGHISGSLDVHQTIGGYEGLQDCTKSAGACVVAAVAGGLSNNGIDVGVAVSSGTFPLGSLSTPDPAAPPVIRHAARGQSLPGVAFAPISFG